MGFLDRLFPGAPPQYERVLNAPVDGMLVRDALTRHGRFRLTARGGSMNPALPDGAQVVIVPSAVTDARLGDIVMANYGGSWHVIHRVVRGPRDGVIRTKGDSLDGLDQPIDESAFLGRAVCYKAGGRFVPLDRGLLNRAGAVLAVLSVGSLMLGSGPARLAALAPGGARASRFIMRALRVPAWALAWCLVRVSSRPVGPRNSDRGRDRSGDRSP